MTKNLDSEKIPIKTELTRSATDGHSNCKFDITMSETKEEFEKVSSQTSSGEDKSSQKKKATISREHAELAKQMEIEVEAPQRSQITKELPSVSKDETPTSSEENELELSPSSHQTIGDTGISMEKSGNSSDEDSNKCQISSDDCNTSSREDESDTDGLSMFPKPKRKVKKRNYPSERNSESDDTDSQYDIDNRITEWRLKDDQDWEALKRICGRGTKVSERSGRSPIYEYDVENNEYIVFSDSDDESSDSDTIESWSGCSDDNIYIAGFSNGKVFRAPSIYAAPIEKWLREQR